MRYVQAILLLVFLGALGIFAVQNTNTITVWFLDWGITAPLALVSVAVYLLGMLTGWTVVAFVSRSLRRVTDAARGLRHLSRRVSTVSDRTASQ